MKKSFERISLFLAFIMVFIGCSTIIYGRFTRQFNPEVSSFGVTISSQENMMVSTTGETGTFKDILKLEELVNNTNVSLTPLVGKVSSQPGDEYKYFSLEDSLGNPAANNTHLAFDLYFIGSSDMNLYFKGSTGGVGAIFDDSDADVHFSDEQRQRLLSNLRIGFLTHSTIYQPSGTGVNVYYTNPVAANIYATSTITTDNYTTFSKLGYSNTDSDTVIAQTKKNEVTKVRVVIWLEDDNLGDLDALCKLTLSIRFEAVLVN